MQIVGHTEKKTHTCTHTRTHARTHTHTHTHTHALTDARTHLAAVWLYRNSLVRQLDRKRFAGPHQDVPAVQAQVPDAHTVHKLQSTNQLTAQRDNRTSSWKHTHTGSCECVRNAHKGAVLHQEYIRDTHTHCPLAHTLLLLTPKCILILVLTASNNVQCSPSISNLWEARLIKFNLSGFSL